MKNPFRFWRRDGAEAIQRGPQDERGQALTELQQAYAAGPDAGAMQAIVEWMRDQSERDALLKADNPTVDRALAPHPPSHRGQKGGQSVVLDEFQLAIQGDYIERPGILSFDAMRRMVQQTPILNAGIFNRCRKIAQFCRVNESGEGPGFTLRHRDKDHELSDAEASSIRLLNAFFANCGWEASPRARKILRRDSFSQFMQKSVRDSMIMDSAPIETELKRDRALGIDGFYAVDGATIRLCSEQGYQGNDEIFALQVVQGRIRTVYTRETLIYEPRNPNSDVLCGGYGIAEVELMIKLVTGFLNAMTYNARGFDENAIPKGLLHLTGNYSDSDLAAFRRFWNSMCKGVNNAFALPVLVSKDQESKASFERFGVDHDDIYFAKWMTFLTSVICAIWGFSPEELNFESFTSGRAPLSGSDTTEKLADAKEKGLVPTLMYYEQLFSDYIVADFSDEYVFRWTGLDEEDRQAKEERQKLVLTVNEMRAMDGLDPLDDVLGNAPLNPTLMSVYMQTLQQPEQPDFGQPEYGQGQGEAPDGQEGEQDQQDNPDNAEEGQDKPDFGNGQPDFGGEQQADFGQGGPDFGKSLEPIKSPSLATRAVREGVYTNGERDQEPSTSGNGDPLRSPPLRLSIRQLLRGAIRDMDGLPFGSEPLAKSNALDGLDFGVVEDVPVVYTLE